jgi:hypothetical protein
VVAAEAGPDWSLSQEVVIHLKTAPMQKFHRRNLRSAERNTNPQSTFGQRRLARELAVFSGVRLFLEFFASQGNGIRVGGGGSKQKLDLSNTTAELYLLLVELPYIGVFTLSIEEGSKKRENRVCKSC